MMIPRATPLTDRELLVELAKKAKQTDEILATALRRSPHRFAGVQYPPWPHRAAKEIEHLTHRADDADADVYALMCFLDDGIVTERVSKLLAQWRRL